MLLFMKELIDSEWGNYYEITTMGYQALIIIMLLLLFVGCFLSGRDERKFST